MRVIATDLPDVLLVEPEVHGDARGFFMETWNLSRYRGRGIDARFAQSNVSRSSGGVLRGLHYQYPNPQGKLVFVLEGEVYDVAVDIRPGSPSFGRWTGHHLSADNHRQLYLPEGFAHGFLVTSKTALFCYFCTREYQPSGDAAIRWDDPAIGIEWPLADPSLSERDRQAPLLADVQPARLPRYEDEP